MNTRIQITWLLALTFYRYDNTDVAVQKFTFVDALASSNTPSSYRTCPKHFKRNLQRTSRGRTKTTPRSSRGTRTETITFDTEAVVTFSRNVAQIESLSCTGAHRGSTIRFKIVSNTWRCHGLCNVLLKLPTKNFISLVTSKKVHGVTFLSFRKIAKWNRRINVHIEAFRRGAYTAESTFNSCVVELR